MDDERRVLCLCRENQGLADYVLQKKREHVDTPKGLSKNLERTFLKAYRNVCDSKDPINTLKDLSQIKPEKGKGKAALGKSKREWYSGWSCMTTLTQKRLVVKFSNPAKYKLTVEGREVANECIMRSGLSNSPPDIISGDEMDPAQPYTDPRSKADLAGPTKAQPCYIDLEGSRAKKFRSCNDGYTLNPCSPSSSHALKACSSSLASDGTGGTTNVPRLPPLTFGEAFEEAYQVIMILDDREKFATKGKKVDNICTEFKIKIEVRRLPVGDCIWIARHKFLGTEYVLDIIVERKNVDDMRSSIRDNRYKDQKLRLQRSGLKKLIYILEGDPNQSEAAESIKTACFTTEILEGFDVLRTNGLCETLRKYGYLTKSVHQYYKSRVNDDQSKVAALCPSFDRFVKRCQDLDKMTISDVFAIQLMQVPQVTEEIAIAVLDVYPTLSFLASAYSHLEGNVSAQEEMLRNQSENVTCATASKNIFKLVWGE